MRTLGRAIGFRVPMCLSQVLLGVVSTKGTYGILVPINIDNLHEKLKSEDLQLKQKVYYHGSGRIDGNYF